LDDTHNFFGVILMPLRFVTPNLDVEIKYKKVNSTLLAPLPPITMRANGKLVEKVRTIASKKYMRNGKALASELILIDPDTQEKVPSHEAMEVLEHYNYRLIDEDGNEVKEDEVQYFAVKQDGSEEEVSPFERSREINIPEDQWVPSTSVDGFIFESIYELFHPDEKVARRLFEEAERRLKEDKVGITTWSWGRGFAQYYAIVEPVIKEGKFIWLMKLTQTKAEYTHMMEVPSEVKVPIKAPPTLQVLPPVQALVVSTKRKKKVD